MPRPDLCPSSPSSSWRDAAPSTLALVLGALVLLVTLAVARPIVAGAQTPGATTVPGSQTATTTITTTDDLLVGSTTVAPSTAPPTTLNQARSDRQAQGEADADTRRVWYIVAALLAVAFLLFLLTLVYWRHTRPVAVPASPDPSSSGSPATRATETDDPPVEKRRKGGRGKHSASP